VKVESVEQFATVVSEIEGRPGYTRPQAFDDLVFRRNSVSGAVEVVPNRNRVVLNEALHQN
jgi:tetrahydrodipicolinate N-succinyltransferase